MKKFFEKVDKKVIGTIIILAGVIAAIYINLH